MCEKCEADVKGRMVARLIELMAAESQERVRQMVEANWSDRGTPPVQFEPLDDSLDNEEDTNNRKDTTTNMASRNGRSPMTLDQMRAEVEKLGAQNQPQTEEDKTREALLATLRELGGKVVTDDALIFEGTKMILPLGYKGNIGAAIRYLGAYEEQQETTFEFSRSYPYRPFDGANAFQVTMKGLFGTVGIGKATQTMFGSTPPRYRTINVGPNETIQVPWGEVRLDSLSAVFQLGADRTPDGYMFELSVEAPRKYRAEIEAFFTAVEDTLRRQSIYKGKAIRGTGMEPEFLNFKGVDPDSVTYSAETLTQLRANLWAVIEHTHRLRTYGMPIKRAVLLEGPFGTGKTMAATLTALKCRENGWTFIECRPGRDDMHEVLATARLYAPAVVHIEDVDTVAVASDPDAMSRLLDTLDGISGKGKEVVTLFTTNYVDRLPKAVMRPGRISSVIHIGALDLPGLTTLVNYKIPADQRDVIDYQAVFDACAGYMPAYVVEVIDRAVRYAVAFRDEVRITTEDLVNAANGLRPQYELQQIANEGVVSNTLEAATAKLITDVLQKTEMVDSDGDPRGFMLAVNDDPHGFVKTRSTK